MLQKKPGVGVPAILGPEDCISYNPAGLSIVARAPFWQLIAGPMVLHIFQARGDAMVGLAIARMHTKQCFIGRGNTMGAQRERYIMEYWK
jgi:hypothetical protein